MSTLHGGDIDQYLTDWLCSSSDDHSNNLEAKIADDPNAFAELICRARASLNHAPAVSDRLAQLAAAVATMRNEVHNSATALRVQGQALRALGRHNEALNVLREASHRAATAGDNLLSLTVLVGCIDSLAVLDRHSEGEALGVQLADELQVLGSPADAARALVNLGNIYFRKDLYEPALTTYQKAEELFGSEVNAVIAAALHTNIANSLTHLDRITESLSRYSTARELYASLDDEIHVAVVDTNLGYLEYVSGHYSQALTCFISAASVFDRCERPHEAARCNIDAAGAYLSLNLYPEALQSCERALQQLDLVSAGYDRGRVHLIAASVHHKMHNIERAAGELDCAEVYFHASRNRVQLAHCALIRAWIFRSMGDIRAAAQAARRSSRAFKQTGLPGWAAEASFLLADLRLALNDDATRQMRAIAGRARFFGRGWLECRAEYALAKYFRLNGDDEIAMSHLVNAVEALEGTRTKIIPEDFHISYIDGKEVIYTDLVQCLLDRNGENDVERALEYVEKSRSRVLLEGVISNHVTAKAILEKPAIAELRSKLQQLREQLSREYFFGGVLHTESRLRSPGAISAESLVALEREYSKLEHAYQVAASTAPGASAETSSLASLERMQSPLANDETLLEFCALDEGICAFIVTRKSLRVIQNVVDCQSAAKAAQRLRFHLQRYGANSDYVKMIALHIAAGVSSTLSNLYDMLLAPLLPLLNTKRIIIVPHGALHGLPFHAFLGPNGPALVDHEFVYAPSCSVWHAVQTRSTAGSTPDAADTSVVFGVPGTGYENVIQESLQVSRLLPGALLRQDRFATVAEFRCLASSAAFIHIAAHAEFRNDNPLFSGLRLADGWLTARDIYDMQLGCKLVTLSACSTGTVGVAPGDELMGLTRGFLIAGANNVAASLWPADDRTTASVMLRFYTHLCAGLAAPAALRLAQLETYEVEKNPYFWAPFIIVGGR